MKKKIRVVYATNIGPAFFEFDSVMDALATFSAWFCRDCSDKTASTWEQKRGKWVPMFEWQMKSGAAV